MLAKQFTLQGFINEYTYKVPLTVILIITKGEHNKPTITNDFILQTKTT